MNLFNVSSESPCAHRELMSYIKWTKKKNIRKEEKKEEKGRYTL